MTDPDRDTDDSEADDPTAASEPAAAVVSGKRPLFAQHYPRDPELDRLVAAFVEGNHALVFEGAPRLADKTDDPAVAQAARDLRARLDPDPLALGMLGGMALLLLFLTFWFYTHRHGG